MSTSIAYRLRIRNASTVLNPNGTADDLVVTSVRGGTNPYIESEPSGDGQEIDPLTGKLRTGTYNVNVMDVITSGTTRVLTSKLFDSDNRQQLLSRRAYVEISTDGGGTWPDVLIAGYVLAYRLADALMYEVQIGDSRRIEQSLTVLDGTSAQFTKRGTIFGGPVIGGWLRAQDRGGWEFRVKSVESVTGGSIVNYDFVSGYLGSSDQKSRDITKLLDTSGSYVSAMATALRGADNNPIAQAAAPYLVEDAPEALGYTGTPGLVAYIASLAGGATAGRFVPIVPLAGHRVRAPIIVASFSPNLSLVFPTGVSAPSVGAIHLIHLYASTVADVSPLYITEHPVDLVTMLWDDAGIQYNAAAAAAVRALLGDTMRVSLRITQSWKLLDFLEKVLFGPIGFAARTNSDGELELFMTRLKETTIPSATLGTSDFQDADQPIFNVEEQTVISALRIKWVQFAFWNPVVAKVIEASSQRPLDTILHTAREIVIESGDVAAFGSKEISYEIPGMVHEEKNFTPKLSELVTGQALEAFDRYGRGATTGEFRIMRASDPGTQVGEELYLQPAHIPNLNKRYGDDPSVGARIVQIVRRTEAAPGPSFKYVDSGSNLQPVTPAPTISIAANAVNPRTVADLTVTNAAAINATGVLLLAIEWATGASSPSGAGVTLTRYKPNTIPTAAFSLPSVESGSKVWARARTEQYGRRPSAWTSWVSVTLTAVSAPTGLTFTNIKKNAAKFNWTNTSSTDLIDVFVAPGSSAPADWTPYYVATVPAGSTSIVVRGLDGPSIAYIGAVMHRNPSTGDRSAAATNTFSTNSTLDTAPDMAGIIVLPTIDDAQLPVGIPLGLYPVDQAFDIQIQRAPDVAGAPGTWADLTTVRGTSEVFVDYLPSDGVTRWYRARATLSGYTPGAWSAEVSGVPGGISAELQAGNAPDLPLCLSIAVTTKPDGTGTISIQCNELTESFKVFYGSAYPSLATLRAVSPTAGSQVDIAFNAFDYPTQLYVSVLPYSEAAGAGTEGPRHNSLQNTLGYTVPQGTVLVDASGNWSASVNVPPAVSEASSVLWAASTSAFPSRATVLSTGTFATPGADGVVNFAGASPLTLGDKIYISIICYAGSGYDTELPIIHVMGSYQSFSATKTFTWSAQQMVQQGASFPAATTGKYFGNFSTLSGEAAIRVDSALALIDGVIACTFGLLALLPANGAVATEFFATLYRNVAAGVGISCIALLNRSTTNLASLTATNTGGWADYTASISETVDESAVYFALVQLSCGASTANYDNLAAAVIAITFTMPTPKAAL